jgi:NAD(P)-dependent dehydrogenase (short-subunit alcohol dehydrogenase family)
MADPSIPVTRGCRPAHPPVNESPAASRHLEVARLNDGIVGLLDTDRIMAAIREHFGAPDVLFRNAGITHPG